MHAHLLVGNNEQIQKEVNILIKSLKSKRIDFDLQKIDHVRQLQKFLKIRSSENLSIVLKSFDNATHQAQSAFLKNLEEPPEKICFILLAKSDRNILDTITSRCVVKKITNVIDNPKNFRFLLDEKDKRIKLLTKKYTREESLVLLSDITKYLSTNIKKGVLIEKSAFYAQEIEKTNNLIKKNANVRIQLLSLLLRLEAINASGYNN